MRRQLIFVLIVFSGIISAQDNNEVIKLNLEKSIELALENNHDIRKAELDRQKALEQVDEAWGTALFPKIDAAASYNRAIKLPVFTFQVETPEGPVTQSFRMGADNTLSASLSVEQTLFSGSVFLAVSTARVYANISDKAFKATRENMIAHVKKAYYSVLVAKEVVELSRQNLKLSQDNLKNAESMYNAGLISEYDQIKARVQVQNLIPNVKQTENALIFSENLLKILTGLEVNRRIQIDDSLSFKEMNIPESEAENILVENNSTLNQLKLQIQFQDKLVSYQFSQHFPELSVVGNWQSQAQENDERHLNNYVFRNAISAGLNLRIPIFSGGQTSSRVQQAKIDRMRVNEDYVQTTKTLRNQLQNTLLRIKETRELMEAYNGTIAQAQRGYEIAVKRFSAGLGTQLEVVDAQVAMTQAKVNYLSAVYDYYSYNADFEQLLGR